MTRLVKYANLDSNDMETLLNKTASIFKTFLDVVLPPVCYVCGRACSAKYGLCDLCLGKIKYIYPPSCPKCAKPLTNAKSVCNECNTKNFYIEKGWSCCHYKDTIKECIHLFKYKADLGLIDIFRDIMLDFIKRNQVHRVTDLIAPVPMYPTKKRERTYNHAEILAQSLSKNLELPMDGKNLKKIRWTRPQSELHKLERLKNVKDTFIAVDKNAFSGKNILLVDDVYTTGATINECAKVLRDAKASKVFSLTLARGV